MRRFVVEASARAELLEVFEWARKYRDADFSDRLQKTMRAAFAELAERPMMWPLAKGSLETRARHLLAIRYTVFYRVTATTVAITGIRHMRRQPRAWRDRR